MTDSPGSDRSLLDRLNALKPSTVNLDPPSKTIAASTIESSKLLSKEDALSERLKSLRNQASSNDVGTTGGSGAGDGSGGTTTSSRSPQPQPQLNPKSPDVEIGPPKVPSAEEGDGGNIVSYDDTDEETLEELLADLEDDQQWIEELIAEEEHRRVTALMNELGNPNDTPETKTNHKDSDGDTSDDDSEGEHMTREANDILAQAADEAELEKANEPPSQPDPTPTSTAQGLDPAPDKKLDKTTAPNNPSPFTLPTVPSTLQDQPTLPALSASQDDTDDDADFAASISNRMAALRVATPPRDLPSAPTSAVDAFGLPVAPTFAPADRPLPGLIKRHGYTDADQKTWCVVCLEDGTVRCLDCDGDAYCARCWREMHVGPRAGYDERGHRWEKLDRGKA